MNKVWYAALIIILVSCAAYAANSPKLEWAASSDADYYVVYWSKTPGKFNEANSMDVPPDIRSVNLAPSPDGAVYYYVVKAFTDNGNSSDLSDQISTKHVPVDININNLNSNVPTTSAPATPVTPVVSSGASTPKSWSSGKGGCFIDSLR